MILTLFFSFLPDVARLPILSWHPILLYPHETILMDILIAIRRFTNRAQDAMDAGMKSAQKAATSAVADAAAREVEKQISAGFGQLMGKRK